MKRSHVGRIFITGLLTVLPVLATLYFTFWLIAGAERFFSKLLMLVIPAGMYHTGMGLVVAVALVFAVGILMHGLLFRRLFRRIERLMLRIPLVRSIYGALRDLFGLFDHEKDSALKVVAVSLPGWEMRLLGFITRDNFSDLPNIGGDDEVAVYLPMSYQIGGYTVLLPRERVQPVDMSREDAVKFILTAGVKAKAHAVKPLPASEASGPRSS
jgi:uncharacterized membrane protein